MRPAAHRCLMSRLPAARAPLRHLQPGPQLTLLGVFPEVFAMVLVRAGEGRGQTVCQLCLILAPGCPGLARCSVGEGRRLLWVAIQLVALCRQVRVRVAPAQDGAALGGGMRPAPVLMKMPPAVPLSRTCTVQRVSKVTSRCPAGSSARPGAHHLLCLLHQLRRHHVCQSLGAARAPAQPGQAGGGVAAAHARHAVRLQGAQLRAHGRLTPARSISRRLLAGSAKRQTQSRHGSPHLVVRAGGRARAAQRLRRRAGQHSHVGRRAGAHALVHGPSWPKLAPPLERACVLNIAWRRNGQVGRAAAAARAWRQATGSHGSLPHLSHL